MTPAAGTCTPIKPRQLAGGALLLLVLAALGLQQWAVQAHWLEHLPRGSVVAAPTGAPGDTSPAHDCRWCQIASHAISAAPPSQALPLPAREVRVVVAPAAYATAHFSAFPSWNWQSRGPPAA
jgi:hypothetical protein